MCNEKKDRAEWDGGRERCWSFGPMKPFCFRIHHDKTKRHCFSTTMVWDHLVERDNIESQWQKQQCNWSWISVPGERLRVMCREAPGRSTLTSYCPLWFFWRVINWMRSGDCVPSHSLETHIIQPQWKQTQNRMGMMWSDCGGEENQSDAFSHRRSVGQILNGFRTDEEWHN